MHDALIELGHKVSIWDYRVEEYQLAEADYAFDCVKPNSPPSEVLADDPEITLCLGPGLNPDILESVIWKSTRDSLRILWNSEPIRLGNYRNKIEANKKHFGMFCTFDESEIPLYKKLGIDAAFLPQAFNPKWYKPLNLSSAHKFRDHFCFIGSVGGKWINRVHFLNRVKASGFKVNSTILFDAVKVNHAYNIHSGILNLGLYCPECGLPEHLKAFGLQQRIFECIGAGNLCITNEIPTGSNELFEHGKNILFYNKENLEEILRMALIPKIRKSIKSEAINIREQHTYKARMEKLIYMTNW
ncbi:MAG: glycosyltransferase family protein [Candidatus Hodarchaeales archaeon]